MEKTTKKRKKSKRLKRRIGLIAVGGLSFVLTICLSVGATLAWFAGSTWASNDLYMGGPVYVEMAGRGHNGVNPGGTTPADGANDADWMGGTGTLDIKASSRSTGTANDQESDKILLPGQKLLVYSQARVFSTLQESTLKDGASANQSSGANNSNTSNGTMTYYNGGGRIQSTTTSVLRAKFSIKIEFDPSVGFNNFTDQVYAQGYPVQSSDYRGEYGTTGYGSTTNGDGGATGGSWTAGVTNSFQKDSATGNYKDSLPWETSLGATKYAIVRATEGGETNGNGDLNINTVVTSEVGRRDAVANTALVEASTVDSGDPYDYDKNDYKYGGSTPLLNNSVTPWVDGEGTYDMWQVKAGLSKCIYKWKYVSEEVYDDTDPEFQVGAPFNGMFNTAGTASANDESGGTGNGFYAIFENDGTNKLESDAYYNARTSAYLLSYSEHYYDEYGRDLAMEITTSLNTLESALNASFIDLVNQSSDNIWAGNVMGFTAEEDGRISYKQDGKPTNPDGDEVPGAIDASWLYVDPLIGNDTNASDSATSVGGWWYLVESTGGNRSSGNQLITTEIDNVTAASKIVAGTNPTGATGATTLQSDGTVKYNFAGEQNVANNSIATVPVDAVNTPIPGTGAAAAFKRYEDDESGVKNTDKKILNAKLYEITPNLEDQLMSTAADGTETTKVVSYAFPFVNGNFELPGQAMTNIFANAKISFQITFQALQAFFPFSKSIDSIPSGTAITGTAKALNIGNAIPIFNEAFDYLSWL